MLSYQESKQVMLTLFSTRVLLHALPLFSHKPTQENHTKEQMKDLGLFVFCFVKGCVVIYHNFILLTPVLNTDIKNS